MVEILKSYRNEDVCILFALFEDKKLFENFIESLGKRNT